MSINTHWISGKTLAKFPDIVQAGLRIKLAQVRTNAKFGFISAQVAKKIEDLIFRAENQPPQELCSVEMWSNDLSVLSYSINRWIACQAQVEINDVSLMDSDTAFSQSVESLVITDRLQVTRLGNRELIYALRQKARDFKNEIRLARVHMCEAMPKTWGQVFAALADSVEHALRRIEADQPAFATVLAGSVIDDNLKAPPEYARVMLEEIKRLTGHAFVSACEKTYSDTTDILMGSSRFMELCADLRILSMVYQRFVHGFFIYGSGPRAGLAEITLPAIAPGSTIMPGKINPSMAMLLEQACQHLSAVDQMAQYSYNEYDFDESWQSSGAFLMTAEALELLGKASHLFVEKCLKGFSIQSENNRRHVENALSYARLIELLKGKETKQQVVELMLSENLTAKDACLRLKVMDPSEVQMLFDSKALIDDGISLHILERFLKKF